MLLGCLKSLLCKACFLCFTFLLLVLLLFAGSMYESVSIYCVS